MDRRRERGKEGGMEGEIKKKDSKVKVSLSC